MRVIYFIHGCIISFTAIVVSAIYTIFNMLYRTVVYILAHGKIAYKNNNWVSNIEETKVEKELDQILDE